MTSLRTLPPVADQPAPTALLGSTRRRLLVGAVVLVVLAAFAVWLVAFSAAFGVGSVVVRGNHLLTADQVRKAAAIAEDTPLIRLDRGAIAARVDRLPDVGSVTVGVDYPSTVIITVKERIAVGYVQAGSSYRLLDRTGTQYRTVSTPPKLPRFVLPSGSAAQGTAAAVSAVAADLPRSLLHRIASIQALDPQAITLLLHDQRIVRWGSSDRSAEKARILPTLLRQPGQTYDVTDPDLPFVRQ